MKLGLDVPQSTADVPKVMDAVAAKKAAYLAQRAVQLAPPGMHSPPAAYLSCSAGRQAPACVLGSVRGCLHGMCCQEACACSW